MGVNTVDLLKHLPAKFFPLPLGHVNGCNLKDLFLHNWKLSFIDTFLFHDDGSHLISLLLNEFLDGHLDRIERT